MKYDNICYRLFVLFHTPITINTVFGSAVYYRTIEYFFSTTYIFKQEAPPEKLTNYGALPH